MTRSSKAQQLLNLFETCLSLFVVPLLISEGLHLFVFFSEGFSFI